MVRSQECMISREKAGGTRGICWEKERQEAKRRAKQPEVPPHPEAQRLQTEERGERPKAGRHHAGSAGCPLLGGLAHIPGPHRPLGLNWDRLLPPEEDALHRGLTCPSTP